MVRIISCQELAGGFYDLSLVDGIVYEPEDHRFSPTRSCPEEKKPVGSQRPIKLSKGKKSK